MTRLHELADQGQSIWLDYIQRSLIESGQLQAWVEEGVRGVTSNPSILQKAIAGSTDYDADLRRLVAEGKSAREIYEALVFEDIAGAADVLRPVYDRTQGLDGYVSLEASPELAHDTGGTVQEIRRFAAVLGRPNVMFKVPATPAGIPGIQALIADGLNVNVTLIFSVSHYRAIAEAYVAGLEELAASGGDISRVASVASVFVSRTDTAVDRALEKLGESDLQGKIALANAKAIYSAFKEVFAGPRWERLAALGARAQRVLWASTSTKNPRYPDTLYVDNLIGPYTVNTVPPTTLQFFLDHGTVAHTLEGGAHQARRQMERLVELGVDLDAITQKLQDDGVAAFAEAFDGLLSSIAAKRDGLLAIQTGLTAHLGDHQPAVDAALSELHEQNVMTRIWARDHTLWKPEPDEIANRLGWLNVAQKTVDDMDCLQALADEVRSAGYTHALLLGMGGSSLAAEVLRKTFGVAAGYLDLAVLDSTDPGAVLAQARRLDPARTLFIVATKSGTTAETLSFFKFFYNWTAAALGEEAAGEHFVAITDPGTRLTDIAQECDFRTTFANQPDIGGRYSALSYFGMVPAALIGLDLELLLDRALSAACDAEQCAGDSAGLVLGAVLSELAAAGHDKLTLVAPRAVTSFGDWVEQLIAESTGKEGKGILPVVGEPLGAPDVYGPDRLFVRFRLSGDPSPEARLEALRKAGHPVVEIDLRDRFDLSEQFFVWEMATAVAGHRMGINPFNQPNVEAAKVLARRMIDQYRETGRLPESSASPPTARELREFLAQAHPGDYIALQAYVQPTPQTDLVLQKLRRHLRDRYHLATTLGYGPRFLHSTGQLHKGDAGRGLFIQFTSDAPEDAAIPDAPGAADSSITFGVLKAAQVLGDRRALIDAGRRVIHIHLGSDVACRLEQLVTNLT